MHDVQTIVIGAGVVGLAIARALAATGREVLVLERGQHVGTETSSRNSEVIHSGIYYAPGSLKARLCVQGRDRLYAYCAERGIPHRRVGKLIVATTPDETRILDKYVETATANGVGALARLDAAGAAELEPEVRCVAALHSPYTGIVDSHALTTSLWSDLEASGGQVAFDSEVVGAVRRERGFAIRVHGGGPPITCAELVNSAGLHAPDLAARFEGCAEGHAPRAHYARGHYFTLTGRTPFRRLVYPVAEAAGLGIHVTLDLSGRARFGPDVEWCAAIDYAFDASRVDRFVAAIRRYYPALEADRLQPAYVGVRPKISGPGEPARDFRIDGPLEHGVPGLVQLYGIESPGLTSSLAIGDHVTTLLS